MIGHHAYIDRFEPIIRTSTAPDEKGQAQFTIGNPYGAHITGYWTVSDLISLSERFGELAVELLGELQRLEHPSIDGAAVVAPPVRVDLNM